MKIGDSRYLGDGVYCTADPSGMLALRTGSHRPEEADNTVWIEPQVVDALLKFIEDWRAPPVDTSNDRGAESSQ